MGEGEEITLKLFFNEDLGDYAEMKIILQTDFTKSIFANLPSGKKLPRCLINEFFENNEESNEWFDNTLRLINGKEIKIIKRDNDNMN